MTGIDPVDYAVARMHDYSADLSTAAQRVVTIDDALALASKLNQIILELQQTQDYVSSRADHLPISRKG